MGARKRTPMEITVGFIDPLGQNMGHPLWRGWWSSVERGHVWVESGAGVSFLGRQRSSAAGDESIKLPATKSEVWSVLSLRVFPPPSTRPKCFLANLPPVTNAGQHFPLRSPNTGERHLLPSESILPPSYPTHNVSSLFFNVLQEVLGAIFWNLCSIP